MKKEQKKRDQLAAKIKAMESKLLAGGNIVHRTDETKKALDIKRQEVIEQKVRSSIQALSNIIMMSLFGCSVVNERLYSSWKKKKGLRLR